MSYCFVVNFRSFLTALFMGGLRHMDGKTTITRTPVYRSEQAGQHVEWIAAKLCTCCCGGAGVPAVCTCARSGARSHVSATCHYTLRSFRARTDAQEGWSVGRRKTMLTDLRHASSFHVLLCVCVHTLCTCHTCSSVNKARQTSCEHKKKWVRGSRASTFATTRVRTNALYIAFRSG